MDKYTNTKVMVILKEYLKKIKNKFRLEKSILFGSRARDDWLLNSDVDLILVSKDFAKFKFRQRMGELLEDWDEDIDLEVIAYTPEEFEKKKNQIGIVRQAVKEGIEI